MRRTLGLLAILEMEAILSGCCIRFNFSESAATASASKRVPPDEAERMRRLVPYLAERP